MNIKLASLLLHNLIRYTWNKLCYGSRYQSSLVQRISSRASISLYKKGKIKLGYNIELAPFTDIQVHGEGRLAIGDHVYMNRGCMISCHEEVSIGKGCMFGPGVKIFDNNHRFSKGQGVSTDLKTGRIVVGDNCWLASDVILLKGARIGDNCVIGAGCVINSDVLDNSVVQAVQELKITPIK